MCYGFNCVYLIALCVWFLVDSWFGICFEVSFVVWFYLWYWLVWLEFTVLDDECLFVLWYLLVVCFVCFGFVLFSVSGILLFCFEFYACACLCWWFCDLVFVFLWVFVCYFVFGVLYVWVFVGVYDLFRFMMASFVAFFVLGFELIDCLLIVIYSWVFWLFVLGVWCI